MKFRAVAESLGQILMKWVRDAVAAQKCNKKTGNYISLSSFYKRFIWHKMQVLHSHFGPDQAAISFANIVNSFVILMSLGWLHYDAPNSKNYYSYGVKLSLLKLFIFTWYGYIISNLLFAENKNENTMLQYKEGFFNFQLVLSL